MKPTFKVAIVTNIAWNIYNFRRGLARAIEDAGYEPVLMASPDAYAAKLEKEGWNFVPLNNLRRASRNPLSDLKLFFDLIRLYKSHSINCALHYTAKPLVYGSLSASLLRIPYLSTITGLAGPFSGDRTIISKIITSLYRISLLKSEKVLFQNMEDLNYFLDRKITNFKKVALVPGSGINLEDFKSEHYKLGSDNKIVFLMFARLSKAKGVEYYVEAARELKKKYANIVFRLAGPFECDELAISKEQVDNWQKEGVIDYIGSSDCIQNEIREAQVIVYPSFYKEGIPKSLIESAAMSRPIITTDNVGCREVVQDGVNGFLVPVKDTQALIQACERFINLSNEEKLKLSAASRTISQQFDEEKVLPEYLSFVNNCLLKQTRQKQYKFYSKVAI